MGYSYRIFGGGGVVLRIINPMGLAISHIQINSYSSGTFIDEWFDDPSDNIEFKIEDDLIGELLQGINTVYIDTQTDNYQTTLDCSDILNGRPDGTWHYYTINLYTLTPTN